MQKTQKELLYNRSALEPFMSKDTVDLHFGKHHANYLAKYNQLIVNSPYDGQDLPVVMQAIYHSDDYINLRNNGLQVENHDFFWQSLIPKEEYVGNPSHILEQAIREKWGGLSEFYNDFINIGMSIFGSGWVWFVLDHGELKIIPTPNANNPKYENKYPLFVCDVWEHAYYLQYKNDRGKFLEDFCKHLLNWHFASKNYENAINNEEDILRN